LVFAPSACDRMETVEKRCDLFRITRARGAPVLQLRPAHGPITLLAEPFRAVRHQIGFPGAEEPVEYTTAVARAARIFPSAEDRTG
jgi:hypothetical protein